MYFTIDPTNFSNLRIKMSPTAPPPPEIERGLSQSSIEFHSKGEPIQHFSDGVKAFSGILMAFTAGSPEVILIDEPEAFLHPALAFSLGKDIAETSRRSEKRLFVATHSAEFLMGAIHSGAPINIVRIVRLTYRGATATARVLPSDKLLKLMRNPLLRSTGILAGMFSEFAVVTEADADRSFYQEVNERLVRHAGAGVSNVLFLNAKNRQTVDQICKPLRELGVPAAVIVDIDVVKEGGVVFTRLLEAAFVPEITRQALATARGHLDAAFKITGKDPVVAGGTSLLSGAAKESAEKFLRDLAEYGIFVVPGGALESWLRSIGGGFPKHEWLEKIFEAMGEDPDSSSYLKPAMGDAWEFLTNVGKWLVDANRKGMPG
jgi:hypothetical protein